MTAEFNWFSLFYTVGRLLHSTKTGKTFLDGQTSGRFKQEMLSAGRGKLNIGRDDHIRVSTAHSLCDQLELKRPGIVLDLSVHSLKHRRKLVL